jgi:PAT family beta-lactamase induction signal transducer AmpG
MVITKQKFFIVWIFGLISGFTIMISSYTLNYWLTVELIDIKTIGIFSLVSLPYAINFTWAPIFDCTKIPIIGDIFGTRLSWIIILQILLGFSVYLMSTFTPGNDLALVALSSLLVSFIASAQDSILGAMRTELVEKHQQGEVSGMYIFGYRIGMLISSSGAIYLSQFLSWNVIYELFSVIIISFPITLILLSKYMNPEKTESVKEITIGIKSGRSYLQRLYILAVKILRPIGNSRYIFLVVMFLIAYRLPDNFISMMITPFLHHIGYGEFEIATAGKLFGAISAMAGGLLASYIMKRKSLYSSLLLFGSIHALAHMLYVFQEMSGKNIYTLFLITGIEGVTGGMSMAAYIAFIASLCDGKFRTTQYAFFSSMMGLSRSIFPSISGYIVAGAGWTFFYLFTTIAIVPSLILIVYLARIRNFNQITQG